MTLSQIAAVWKRLPAGQRRRITISLSLAFVVVVLWLAAVDLNGHLVSRILIVFFFSPFFLSFVTGQRWTLHVRKAALAMMVAGFAAAVLWLMFLPLRGSLWANVAWKAVFFAYLLFGLYLAQRQWRCRLLQPARLLQIIELAVTRMETTLCLVPAGREQGALTAEGLPQHVFIHYSNGNWLEWFHPRRRQSWPVADSYYVVQSNGKHITWALKRWLGSYCEVKGRRRPQWQPAAPAAGPLPPPINGQMMDCPQETADQVKGLL